MMMHDESEIKELDDLLEAAARDRDVPPGLTARVLVDAERAPPRQLVRRKPERRRSILAALGGWQAMGGLALASCAGFWIGINPPAGLPDAGGLMLDQQVEVSLEIMDDTSGFGWDLEEG
jgi:hypothetical protein